MTVLLASIVGFQGVFDMGGLTNTLSQGAVTQSEGKKAVAKSRRPVIGAAALRFTPSKAVRTKAITAVADSYRASNPQFAREMRAAFSQSDPIVEMTPGVRKLGLDPHNLGDAMALYLVQAWYGVRGKVAGRPADYQSVARQWRAALRRVPQTARLSNATKQELGETMLLYGAIAESFVKVARKNPSKLAVVKANLRREVKTAFAIDLGKLRLGANGLFE